MFRVGAHVSVSDGFKAAVEHEVELGGNCGQMFVGSPRGWAVSDVDETVAKAFQDAADERDVGPWIVHGTYLMNLATPKDDLASRSFDCVQDELDAVATLDIPYYVFHTGAGEETGVENVGERLSNVDVPDDVTLLFQTAHDVPADHHLQDQAAFQDHVDNAVSKTVNLPQSASVEDVKEIFLSARDLDLEGITVFRSGAKTEQVLGESPPKEECVGECDHVAPPRVQ